MDGLVVFAWSVAATGVLATSAVILRAARLRAAPLRIELLLRAPAHEMRRRRTRAPRVRGRR